MSVEHISSAIRQPLQSQINEFPASFYFYDIDGLKKHLNCLSQSPFTLWYAVKANPLSRILQLMNDYNIGLDVASTGELNQCFQQTIASQMILNTGPSKPYEQLQSFVKAGVNTYVAESIQQIIDLNRIANEHKIKPRVLLRVQLNWEADNQKTNMLGGDQITPFGLDPENWLQLRQLNTNALDICGFHVFQWGNLLDIESITYIWRQTLKTLLKLNARLKIPFRIIDLGGGIGIPYHQKQHPIHWHTINDALKQLQKQFCPQTRIWLELGRYAVGEYGYYVTTVVDKKTTHEQNLLILDGGINHLVRPALLKQSLPVSLLRDSQAMNVHYQLHGPLCTGLDTFGRAELPEDISIGDKLIFHQCGAYGFTESMPFFLCHDMAAELIYEAGQFKTLRPAQSALTWLY